MCSTRSRYTGRCRSTSPARKRPNASTGCRCRRLFQDDGGAAARRTRAGRGRLFGRCRPRGRHLGPPVADTFRGDRNVAGRTVRVGGVTYVIAGVIDSRRAWPLKVDLWLPLLPGSLDADARTRRDNMIFQSVARLRSGVSLEQGRARVRAIAARVAREHPESRAGWSSQPDRASGRHRRTRGPPRPARAAGWRRAGAAHRLRQPGQPAARARARIVRAKWRCAPRSVRAADASCGS